MRATANIRCALLGLAVAFAACSEAGGGIRGGNLTDAGAEATTPPEPTEGPCIGEGTKWSDLYRDIFGPTGRPGSCSFRSECHGTPEAKGAHSGLKCFDEKSCREWLVAQGWATTSDAENPEGSGLLSGLLRFRQPDGKVSGFMPKTPSNYLFSPACLDRVKAWIRAGVPDD